MCVQWGPVYNVYHRNSRFLIDRWLLYADHFAQVQLGPGVAAIIQIIFVVGGYIIYDTEVCCFYNSDHYVKTGFPVTVWAFLKLRVSFSDRGLFLAGGEPGSH